MVKALDRLLLSTSSRLSMELPTPAGTVVPGVAAEFHRPTTLVMTGKFSRWAGLFALSLCMKMRSYATYLLLKSWI